MTAVEWLFLMMNNPNTDQDFANKLFEKAKEMENEQKITQQLFLGKVSEIIGFSETIELLKESKETFNLSQQDKP